MPGLTPVALRVVAGPAAGASIGLDTLLYFGRGERPGGVDFSADTEMSRRHARFTRLVSGATLVEDLGSGNGTVVNGERIEVPRLMQLGDTVQLGQTVVRLEQVSDEAGKGAGRAATVSPEAPALPTLPPPAPAGSSARSSPPEPGRGASRDRRGAPADLRGTSRDRRYRALAAGAALVLVAGAGVVTGRITSGQGTASQPDAGPGARGTVFVESGAYQPGANAILAYRYRSGGDLKPLDIRAYPTGGSAGFDLDNTGALDADGQLLTSADGNLLFAVNQGSDTVAVFHIGESGALSAVPGSPFPSGGTAPAGLGLSGDRLVVVNNAQDGVRDLRTVAPTIATFLVQSNGSLRATGSVVTLPAGTSPTEALVTPDGKVVVVPEEQGPLISLTLSADGRLAVARGSPVALPGSIFPPGFPADQEWSLGLSAQPRRTILNGRSRATHLAGRCDIAGLEGLQEAKRLGLDWCLLVAGLIGGVGQRGTRLACRGRSGRSG